MPIDIEGWIEYSPYESLVEREEEYAWISWMQVGSVIMFNDEVNWRLFGNPRDFHNQNLEYNPIAKSRGFPENPSDYLTKEIKWIAEFKKKYGKGNFFGFTNFDFSEIEKIDWKNEYDIINSDWLILFELIKTFKELKKLQSEQIRFTVWYNW